MENNSATLPEKLSIKMGKICQLLNGNMKVDAFQVATLFSIILESRKVARRLAASNLQMAEIWFAFATLMNAIARFSYLVIN